MITLLQPFPAALIKMYKKKIMIITDLHIGWERALYEKGIHVPNQTPKLLQPLTTLISKYKPDKLIILGDVKHSVATAEISEWRDVPSFFSELKEKVQDICIIRGNHDGNLEPLLPENIKLLPATGTTIGEIGVFHGHRWPSPKLLKCKTLIMGHVHPVLVFRDPAGFKITRQVWAKVNFDSIELCRSLLQKHKIKIEKTSEETLQKNYNIKLNTSQFFIMPAFNVFLGGKPLNARKLSVNSKAEKIVGPILRLEAINMEKSETYLLDGTFLGTIKHLKTLS